MATTAADLVAEAKARIDQVSPQQAFDEVASGSVVLLDIREPVEWEIHIDGATQVPRGLLEWAADPTSPRHVAGLDPSQRVIVYCRSGTRAALAVQTLRCLGYMRVANLDGGINAWKAAGLPVTEHHEGV
jgi:rhodanese-related sulfurtransferase